MQADEAAQRSEWGEALPRAQQVSCLWHWPAAPCSSATPSKDYCPSWTHGLDCMRPCRLPSPGPNSFPANQQPRRSPRTCLPPGLTPRSMMTTHTSRQGQAPIVALAGAEYVRIWTSAAMVACKAAGFAALNIRLAKCSGQTPLVKRVASIDGGMGPAGKEIQSSPQQPKLARSARPQASISSPRGAEPTLDIDS
jgi:hypothetical protein